jgi:hypothetical protein
VCHRLPDTTSYQAKQAKHAQPEEPVELLLEHSDGDFSSSSDSQNARSETKGGGRGDPWFHKREEIDAVFSLARHGRVKAVHKALVSAGLPAVQEKKFSYFSHLLE